MTNLVRLRQDLHSRPELSGKEKETSGTIRDFLSKCDPDRIIEGLGGHGLAAVYNGRAKGSRILLRCELDGLPIPETLDLPYASRNPGVGHKCGHDGHMAIIAGVACHLMNNRPSQGSVVLLFQPSEENGMGAAKVIDDPGFRDIEPDFAFALHNLPGFPMGSVIVRKGVFASASTGLKILLHGETSHAAEPEGGKSPAMAVAQLISGLSSLPQYAVPIHRAAKVTVIFARIGEIAFGTSPGEGSVMATLRAYSQDVIDILIKRALRLAEKVSETYDLKMEWEVVEPFPATDNDPESVDVVEASAERLGMPIIQLETPFGWSEDFGHFTDRYRGALFGLGAGEEQPVLHHPTYDFPEALIEPGVKVFSEIIRKKLG